MNGKSDLHKAWFEALEASAARAAAGHNPHYRTVLSAALDWHAIVKMANALPQRSMRDALVVIALAAAIHEAPIPVRMVAWEQYTRCNDPNRETLLLIVKSRRPLSLVHMILQEMNL